MLTIRIAPGERALLPTQPAWEAIVSWNTRFPAGTVDLVVHGDAGASSRLPYVAFSESTRRSRNGQDARAKIEIDVVKSSAEMRGIEVHADIPLDAIAVSIPFPTVSSHSAERAPLLDVPARSQYLAKHSGERGWCSPASLCMLLAYWGIELTVPNVATRVYDEYYGCTGNWTFNTALAGMLGLRGVAAHLRNLAHAGAFIAAGIPLALSYSWKSGELPGAPLEHSGGHLAVLRGFNHQGDPVLNDPAQPTLTVAYPYAMFEHVWLAHGAVAYLIGPSERTDELVHLTNT